MRGDDRDRVAALADRSRRRVFDVISAVTGPVAVAELAEACGIHPNTVRLHLERLVHAGLVTRAPDGPRRPGRPPHRYVATGNDPAGDTDAYRRLAGLLAEAVPDGATARRAGRAEAIRRSPPDATDAVAAVAAAMAAEGFRPVVDESGPRPEVLVQACPFAEVAAQYPATICQLHLGIAEGAAEAVGGVSVERLIVRNPFEAGCRLVLRRQDANDTST